MLFDTLGFTWDRAAIPQLAAHSVERACFQVHKLLPQHVWEAASLSGNPLPFSAVKTLVDGVILTGENSSHHNQVLGLAAGYRHLLKMVRDGRFAQNREVFLDLHRVVNGDPGASMGPEQSEVFDAGAAVLQSCTPVERATAFLALSALNGFFVEGGWPTCWVMMHGALVSAGVEAPSVASVAQEEFKALLARFRISKEATELIRCLAT